MAELATRARWRRVDWGGWLVLALCAIVACVRAFTAHVPPPARRLTDAERVEVGRAAAAAEPGWRRNSHHSFPGDHWSQDDDFGAAERSWALSEAAKRGVPVTDVLRAIDEELHSGPVLPPRKASASPSKPRPFYD
jgi:hypothetical protein